MLTWLVLHPDGVTVADIVSAQLMDTSTVSGAIKPMMEKGAVESVRGVGRAGSESDTVPNRRSAHFARGQETTGPSFDALLDTWVMARMPRQIRVIESYRYRSRVGLTWKNIPARQVSGYDGLRQNDWL